MTCSTTGERDGVRPDQNEACVTATNALLILLLERTVCASSTSTNPTTIVKHRCAGALSQPCTIGAGKLVINLEERAKHHHGPSGGEFGRSTFPQRNTLAEERARADIKKSYQAAMFVMDRAYV